jgi:activating signal cointegrator 1
MKALSLTAPYGTLIALAAQYPELGKHIETRSWQTTYRGPLAIHQAQGLGPVGGKRGLVQLIAMSNTMRETINRAGFTTVDDFPRGAIVAMCELVACEETDPEYDAAMGGWWKIIGGKRMRWELTDQERAFGDYSAGRYAWLLSNIRALPEPIPARGALGLWNYEGVL